MKYVVNGVRYSIESWGEGYPLLLLHGFTGDRENWREFKPYWQRKARGIAVDIIGHGQTDCPEDASRYSIEWIAEDLANLLEQLEIEYVDVLGYSMGGRLALTFAILYPQKVRRLIIESASPGLLTETERISRRIQDKKLAQQIVEQGIARFVDYWENIPLFQSQKNLSSDKVKKIRTQRLKNDKIGLSNSLIGMGTGAQPSWWDALAEVNIPVLMITGSLDKKFCLIAEKMQKRLPNSQWVAVEHAGHAIHVERPEIFGTIVSEFLSKTT